MITTTKYMGAKIYREKNKDIIKERKASWYIRNKTIIQSNMKSYKNRWYKNNSKNPEVKNKLNARWKAGQYIVLSKLCEVCNNEKATERHHQDYSKPLEIISCCRKCHILLDSKIRLTQMKGGMENIV